MVALVADRCAQAQAPGDTIKIDYLSGINPVRIVDLLAIQAPNLRPAPWVL